ncbi:MULTISPECIES: YadA-like family protein [Veillonella]|uniref:YadA-like family protein n=1 Tax=Veillonella TaxID=29465 RepID=UPI001D36743A|nr:MULTISPECIES: YadA-like family protein [Veillonella]MBS6963121.1 YadA-like family protein [Veillonella sp.]MDU2040814.1 ESPR-type extended signal peptide-containing protein [Veillonella parvula]MDU6637587.1 ESPR-type extended signal peptide-containing protein [Veillonella parvula]
MNRIYNVIWSKTKKCYVVVSEIVKTGGGKVKSVQSGTTWTHMSAIMAVAALLMAGNITTVNAATYTAMTINDVNGAGYATGNVVYSEGSYLYNYQNPGNLTPFDNSHLYNGTDRGNYTENSFAGIAIGKNTNIQETGNPTYYSGLAIGNYAQATGGIAFALGHYAQALSPSAMALGTATKASGFNSLAMMRQSAAEGEFSAALGTAAWAKGNGSFAMGYSATAKADQSIAIGAAETIKLPGQQHGTPSAKYNGDGNTVTEGARSLAFGTKARTAVGADDSMAFGSSSSTGGANAVAMGYSANASAENAFAIGNTAQSSAQNAVAMGKSANASGVSSFAMGSSSNAAGADAIAMGSSSQAKLSNSIALGGNAKSLGADALALGGAANASKDGAIAIGKEAKANNTNTTAIGLGATVTGTNSMAIGTNAVAESNNSLALGTGTEVRGALVNGFSAFTNQQNNNIANGVVAVGNVGSERRIINVAGGENDTDATNVKQLKFVNSNLAKSIAGPTYTGYEANGSTYKAPDFNIKNSTYHTVKEAVEAAQTNFFSAKGTSADANYNNAGATGNNATAAGVRTSAAGNFATAVGADATAANANSTAIGYKAKSSVDDGVALGANSVASVAAGKAGYNVKTADSRTNGYSGLTGAALTSTMGAVSVGDGGTKTRQITNVAAGTADSDAVNVAQLRNVNLKVAGNSGNNDVLLDNQTLTVKGDGSYVTTSVNNQTIDVTLTDATKNKIDNAANKDLSNITDGGKSVIRDEAQKAVKVVAGKNTTITEGTDGTYKTYKVDVDAPDYQLVENSSAADKAYTVSGNKVDLTVQDAKNPANKKTVTIKDIASKTELDDTKTELINKGLKFDADNGGEKTNKLGSKVTVAGDGTNISTTITQTGDDTTIKVALGKDINVNTVTATKTVKAGTATMGNQAVTDNKSASQNGNFVSGLDNKSWTLTDPTFVSGRAATEDQLKIVSDAVKAANAANASATDYRLIANPNNAADGSYKVDNNKVDLQVKDDKSGTVNTVTIKDIASKTELDKVKDRSVKYDGNTGHDTVTLEGANGTKITNLKDGNVAAGSKDAVNGGQLHQVKQDLGDQITNTKNDLNNKIDTTKQDLIDKGLKFDANNGGEKTNKLGSKVTVKGDNSNIITEISQDGNGDSTIDVKLGKNLNVETITATGANGKEGKIGINGKDGVTTNISVTRDGQPGVDGAPGATTTRITYQKPDGTSEEVATLNDGLKFKGDMGATSNVKLNKQVDITGGVTSASDLATGNNIGVTSAAVGADGNAKLQLQLAKNLTGLQSVTASDTVKAGTATVGNHTVADKKGGNQTGNFVTGLDNRAWDISDPTYVEGRAATEDQLKKVSDALKASNASATDYRLIANPNNAADGSYKVENNQVDLKVKDEKSSDVKTVTIKDIASKTELDKVKDRSVKYDGNTGHDTVTLEGQDGTKITNLKDGNVAAGSKDAVNGGQLHQVKQDLGDQITNTKNDLINTGLKFDANVGGVQTNKLGSTVTIQGEGTAADADYSGENLKTFIKQDAATGNTTIDVKMNKNLKAESMKVGKNGKDGVSITGPDTANGTDGKVAVTDKNGKEAVSISGKDGVGHIGLTGPAGTNGVNGTNGIDLSVKPGYDDPATGVKGEKGVDGTNGLTRIVYTDGNGEHQVATMEDGLQFTGNNTGTVNKQKLNSLVKVQGEGVTESESAAFKSAAGNINVKADGTNKLELQLAKDLKNLDSVTAAKTVKAGGATMGGQTVNNTAGDSETGNYVTGLDNKDWDANKIVSGRAATEDQLKKALDAQSANSTDYRLIRNQAAGSNGDYTVDANGDVALTVQDKNHPDKTETVTIKDVASKSKLDKLNDRAVKYDLDPTGNPDKSKVTYEGPAYNNKQGGTHVTNVAYATGNDGSEAVNVDYLNDKIKDSADALTNKGLKFDANQGGEKTNKLGSKVTIKGEGTAADEDYSGENLKTFITQDQTSGDTTINVKMNKNLKAESVKVGKDGKNGVSITGPDNGTDGKVAVTGKDGKEAVSISGKDGVGHIGLNGKDGHSADISVEKGDPDLNGNEITRIKYTDEKGKTHQVATKDDGMAYGGDNGDVIKKKLNEQLDIKGGVTNEADLTENNIGVISKNNILNVRLAKDLKDLNSITFNNGANGANGKTVVNGEGMTINDAAGNPLTAVTKDGVKITDGPSMTKDGIDAAGNKITNVQDGNVAKDSKDAVNGGQLHDAVESLKSKGFGLEAEDGQSVKKALGETVKVKGDDTNIKTSVDDGAVKVELKKDITVDTVTATTVTTGDTKMDTNGVTIKDGANEATKLTKDGLQINDGGNKAVTINKDGLTIENGPKVTKEGIDAADKKITNVADGTIGAGSKDAVNGGQLHTAIEDIKSTGFGLKAEDGNSVKKPLGETIDLKGDGNIKTSVDNGAIKMALNDKITLGQDPAKQVKIDGSEGTVTAGNGDKEVKLDGSAGTITAGKGDNQVKIDGNNGSVTANTVKAGDVVVGKQTSDGKEGNFVTGLDNKTWDPENPVAVPGRAATEDQLKAVNDDFNNKARTGRVFQGDQLGDSGKVVRGLGDTMNLTGGADVNRLADNNIGVVKNAAGDGYNIKLAKDLKGLESVTTTDAAGNTTVINGGGMTITPAQGNAVSLTKDGLNNGGNRITNVGPGVDGTDAVNVNQLSSAMRSVDGKIADVGATSAAISGLKPLQYDPLEPTQVLAAVGHYKGSTAAAVGVAHYTNESTMFHMGVSLGGHDNMINAGVSYKFGTSDAKKAVPARYKAGPISSAYVLQDEVTALKAENERMKQHDLELTAKYDQVQRDNEEMKAQIALLMQQAGLTK